MLDEYKFFLSLSSAYYRLIYYGTYKELLKARLGRD